MPESLIALTEGSGKNLHSFQRVIGANTVEDQAVIQGEPYLASYMIATEPSSNSALNTANAHLLQITAGASLKVRIRRIEVIQYSVITAAAFFDLRIMRLSTAGTGGTILGPTPFDPADAAAGASSMILQAAEGTEN